jgi:hypothetical protein
MSKVGSNDGAESAFAKDAAAQVQGGAYKCIRPAPEDPDARKACPPPSGPFPPAQLA